MRATISWWDLAGSGPDLATLRADLDTEALAAWSAVDGLRLKVWFSDPDAERWGAVMLWDDDADTASLPPNRAARLVGRPATVRLEARVEELVEGRVDGAVDGLVDGLVDGPVDGPGEESPGPVAVTR